MLLRMPFGRSRKRGAYWRVRMGGCIQTWRMFLSDWAGRECAKAGSPMPFLCSKRPTRSGDTSIRIIAGPVRLRFGWRTASGPWGGQKTPGARLFAPVRVQSQGIEIKYPVWEWILDKDYSHRVVAYDGNEKDESYVGLGPTREYGFA